MTEVDTNGTQSGVSAIVTENRKCFFPYRVAEKQIRRCKHLATMQPKTAEEQSYQKKFRAKKKMPVTSFEFLKLAVPEAIHSFY